MKWGIIVSVLCFSVLTAQAQMYRSGNSSKSNFGGNNSTQKEDSSVPGANSNIQTRTFSNYSSRRNWSKGVQTKPVQTTTAGSQEYKDQADAQSAQADAAVEQMMKGVNQQNVGKSGALQNVPASAPQSAANTVSAGASSASSNQVSPAQSDPAAAMMQQVQQMQQMIMGNNNSASSGTSGMPTMPMGANMPGMPDLSALLNAASAGQQPAKSK